MQLIRLAPPMPAWTRGVISRLVWIFALFLAWAVLAAEPLQAAPLRVLVLPLLRGTGISAPQAAQLQDAITVELISHTDATILPMSRLEGEANQAKLASAMANLAQPLGPATALSIGALAKAAGATRVLVARLEALPGGGRLLLVAAHADASQLTLAAELRGLEHCLAMSRTYRPLCSAGRAPSWRAPRLRQTSGPLAPHQTKPYLLNLLKM